MTGAVALARELSDKVPGAVLMDQFNNSANPDLHKRPTGPEIIAEADGVTDAFVCAVGTGGTITGVGQNA